MLRKDIALLQHLYLFKLFKSGGDVCGFKENEFDSELCENWIKAGSMSPLMKLTVNSDSEDDVSQGRLTCLQGLM